eukprot:Tbor_TRINITY_DN633_c0_g1::TRINITY_DN633_c0_g1_i1::g.1637::m.1637
MARADSPSVLLIIVVGVFGISLVMGGLYSIMNLVIFHTPYHIEDAPTRHLSITLAFFPLSFVLGHLIPYISFSATALIREYSTYFGSDGILAKVGASVTPMSQVQVPTLCDIQCLVIFWLCVYGLHLLFRRLVDLQRVLKVARRQHIQGTERVTR